MTKQVKGTHVGWSLLLDMKSEHFPMTAAAVQIWVAIPDWWLKLCSLSRSCIKGTKCTSLWNSGQNNWEIMLLLAERKKKKWGPPPHQLLRLPNEDMHIEAHKKKRAALTESAVPCHSSTFLWEWQGPRERVQVCQSRKNFGPRHQQGYWKQAQGWVLLHLPVYSQSGGSHALGQQCK